MPKQNPLQKIAARTNNLGGNVKLALMFAGLVLVWMLTGLLSNEPEQVAAKTNKAETLKTVQALAIEPENYTRFVEITGSTEPDQLVNLAARTESQVMEILKDRGEAVEKGQTLLMLDQEQRAETLEAAKLDLKRAQSLYNAASKLNQQGYRADNSLDVRRAELALAKEVLKRAENDLAYTKITSPIKGMIEDRMVEVGDYVKRGTVLYQVVSTGLYKVVAYVSQQDRSLINPGATAYATLANGQEVSGTITFIASHAENITRTYKVEIEVTSADPIPTGMSAKVRMPTRSTPAYLLPYAAMVLSDEGRLGAMILNADDTTQFVAINPLDDTGNGIYITGVGPGPVTAVVKGQSALVEGEKVQKQMVDKAPQVKKAF